MAPGAITPAGREAAKRAPSHRRRLGRGLAPKSPRRVSGPATGRAGATVPPRPGIGSPERPTRPQRATAPAQPARPQRAPGPAQPARPQPGRRQAGHAPARPATPLAARALAFVRSLPDHPLLDRMVRGRAWIALLAVMLMGIVALQVEVLKLGAGIGRSIERTSTLQSRNELLRASVAELSDDRRIMRLAAAQGMVVPPPAGVGFLSAGAARLSQALSNIHPPNATAFTTMSTTNGAVTTPASLAAATGGGTAAAPASTGVTPSAGTSTPATSTAAVAPASSTTAGGTTVTPSATGTTLGAAVTPAGATATPAGATITPAGAAVTPAGATAAPLGAAATPQTSGTAGSGGAPTG